MSVPAHLTIPIAGLPFEKLLADWRWLVPEHFAPLLMTAFGDTFFRSEDGCIHLLNLMSGEFKVVSQSEAEFVEACDNREQRRSWFLSFLRTELKAKYGALEAKQCYSCKIPLSLGGQLEADNFKPMDLLTYFSVLGQLHRQTKHLPPSKKIGKTNIVAPGSKPTNL